MRHRANLLYFGYLSARLLACLLPRAAALRIARRVALIWYWGSPRLRANLDYNLSRLPALASDAEARARIARSNAQNFAEVVTEFLYLPRTKPETLARLVDLESVARLKSMAKGRPVFFVTPHVGNWELAAATLAMTGFGLHVIVYDHPDRRIADLFRRRREEKGLTVMSVRSAARNMAASLDTVSVGLAGDRDYTGHGAAASLLGVSLRVPFAYAGLALSRSVDVIPACCLKKADGKYHVESDGAIELPKGETADPMQLVGACLRSFEKYIEKYPEQWYLFEKLGNSRSSEE